MSQVKVRCFNPDSDSGFIYGTFTKGLQFGSRKHKGSKSHAIFTKQFAGYLQDLISSANIYMAVLPEEDGVPEFLIGYSIINDRTLEWVFVKPAFRRQGIGTLLVHNKDIEAVNDNNLTELAFEILETKPDLFKEGTL